MSPGLGRGLGALIPPQEGGSSVINAKTVSKPANQKATKQEESAIIPFRVCPIESVVPNPKQPRHHFDPKELEDLSSSIKEHGIVEPLVVTDTGRGKYELIAGERRLRAAKLAGLKEVPCVIRSATEQQKLELAIIENVQRHDLNPIEEALAYKQLVDEFSMTQDEVSDRVGKSRPQVANIMRLLQLPGEVQQALIERKISASNARTLLAVKDKTEQMKLFQELLEGKLTVRETESRVPHPRKEQSAVDPNVIALENDLRSTLGHRVRIAVNKEGRGDIKIHFDNAEDLDDLMNKLTS